MSLADGDAQLLAEAAANARRIVRETAPTARRATVVTTDPISILYDGVDEQPSVVPPQTNVHVQVGDRVQVLTQRGQSTIIGICGGLPRGRSVTTTSTGLSAITPKVYGWLGDMGIPDGTNYGPFTYTATAAGGTKITANRDGIYSMSAWVRPSATVAGIFLRTLQAGLITRNQAFITGTTGSAALTTTAQLQTGQALEVQLYIDHTASTTLRSGHWSGLEMTYLGAA